MEKKKILTGAGILGFLGTLILLIKRAKAAPPTPPPPPPPPGMATLYGKVTDVQTGQPIESLQVTFNGYAGVTQQNGRYLVENIAPGDYGITFYDPLGRYETLVL